ncbi:MAG: hypothetical protein CV087_08830 [Candidatus Brocadia sp. WS118]|nr:MAG: hypothetical protein CV087_08830 [Candidatus Brocadia sp. WS118]
MDFMPNFKKQEENFKNEKTRDGKSWPYVKPTEQRTYEDWLAEVTDPVSGEFYKDKDDINTARHVINTIVRIKLVDGSEKLYTLGSLIGYNSFGDETVTKCRKPEVYQKTIFGHKTGIDKKTRKLIKETTGPIKTETQYLLDFTIENLEKLYSQRENNNGVNLVVKDEANGEAHNIRYKNPQTSYDLFKNKDFDYLFNAEYLSKEERIALQKQSEELLQKVKSK